MTYDIVRFYEVLSRLEAGLGGMRMLSACDARTGWPERGVYFFFEPGEERSGSGVGPRVVRVGTHALKAGSRTSLWNRLSGHRGVAASGSGNHRGSIFRLLVGDAWLRRQRTEVRSWGVGGSVGAAVSATGLPRAAIEVAERPVEEVVSRHIGAMPFLWLAAPDPAGPDSVRGVIERGAIALLSQSARVDPPSAGWLGRWSSRDRVRGSGLWNNNHVDDAYDPRFLDALEQAVDDTTSRTQQRAVLVRGRP